MDRYIELEQLIGKQKTSRSEFLANHSTFQIGGPADMLCRPETRDELMLVLRWLKENEVPWHVIGNGSNILFSDKGFPGIIIKIRGGRPTPGTLWHIEQDEDRIYAGAGVSLARIAAYSVQAGLSGMEWGTGIPGVVGGSIRGNAGAHGADMSDYVESIEIIDTQGEVATLLAEDVGFSYRHTSLDPSALITQATFKMTSDRPQAIRERIRTFTDHRKQTQPSADQSAGCMFKNPPDDSAGRLIDQAGCKGLQVGAVSVSNLHANFIINRGGATAADTLSLISEIQRRVLDQTGVSLEREVKVIGVEGL